MCFCAVLVFAAQPLYDGEPWAVVLASVIGAAMIVCVIIVQRQPQSKAHLFFKVSCLFFSSRFNLFFKMSWQRRTSSSKLSKAHLFLKVN